MPIPDPSKILPFKTADELQKWLTLNSTVEKELWVKIFKKKTAIASVTWDDVVNEALCVGWIDGIKKSIDEQTYVQRISPRKVRSPWSKRNREIAERLILEGRMAEMGLAQVQAAKSDGRWENAYTASEIEVPEDFMAALAHEPKAKKFFETLSKSNRYVIALGLTSAKKPETRQNRFEKYLTLLSVGQKPS
jgi:uncharacterized protein YdeI (YjbR/CyaY-like superfamily)